MVANYQQSTRTLQHWLQTNAHGMDAAQLRHFVGARDQATRAQLQTQYQEGLQRLGITHGQEEEEEKPSRATVLNKMYSLTGESKYLYQSSF